MVISGEGDFSRELYHHAEALEVARSHNPDWLFWFDADEVIDRRLALRAVLEDFLDSVEGDAVFLKLVNVWEKEGQARIDGNFRGGSFVRFVRNVPHFQPTPSAGLHSKYTLFSGLSVVEVPYLILHYGFMTESLRSEKLVRYVRAGQTSDGLNWFVKEEGAQVTPLADTIWRGE
jgi:hypothetical protein